jgi:hypothetical protein
MKTFFKLALMEYLELNEDDDICECEITVVSENKFLWTNNGGLCMGEKMVGAYMLTEKGQLIKVGGNF